jgi:hypothetical protein
MSRSTAIGNNLSEPCGGCEAAGGTEDAGAEPGRSSCDSNRSKSNFQHSANEPKTDTMLMKLSRDSISSRRCFSDGSCFHGDGFVHWHCWLRFWA